MQKTNYGEYKTDEDLQPDHHNIGIRKDTTAASPPNARRLLHGRPCRQPAEADGKPPGQGCDDEVSLGDSLGDVVRREEGFHGTPTRRKHGCMMRIADERIKFGHTRKHGGGAIEVRKNWLRGKCRS